ncbi:MAG: PTS sugar transporter subunit IIA [Victivallaceae bacterium]|nr:PTS sugar transporter subunit IIA [Victivallaceae bacterium]
MKKAKDSIPYKVLSSGNNVIMFQTRKPQKVNIQDIIWDELIKLPMTAANKTDAIAQLIQQLADNDQIAQAKKDEIMELFLKKEKLSPTGVGQGTAFPHIILSGFWGLVSCMGICPSGVSFSNDANRNIKIIFLTISSPIHRTEYLNFLAQVAGKMIHKKTRNKLLSSKNPREVLSTLQLD